jgi:hypothetical protein
MQHRLVLLLVAAFALGLACNKHAARTEAPEAAAADASAAPESLEDLQRQLGELTSELEQRKTAGPTPAGDGADAGAASGVEDRCTRTCELTETICGLSERICGLASEHDGESRYADACTRATDDCDRATEACDGCST